MLSNTCKHHEDDRGKEEYNCNQHSHSHMMMKGIVIEKIVGTIVTSCYEELVPFLSVKILENDFEQHEFHLKEYIMK